MRKQVAALGNVRLARAMSEFRNECIRTISPARE